MAKRRRSVQGRTTGARDEPWLVLVHQIPPKPDYLRVRIGRRLESIGAVALKNSVYVLPNRESCLEDLQWVANEITSANGSVWLTSSAFMEGTDDGNVQLLFDTDRTARYRAIAEEARAARRGRRPRGNNARDAVAYKRRLEAIVALDFFGAKGRADAEAAVAALQRPAPVRSRGRSARGAYTGRTWVTRRGVHVDRIASAWLIRRFIDPRARFLFVDPAGYHANAEQLRFDMFQAEFTHEGDACTFEVLCKRFGLRDAALASLARIVHDLDCKDDKFGLPETSGVGRLIDGIAREHAADDARVAAGSGVLNLLYVAFAAGRRAK
jgi:hypothetical protein